MEHRTKSTLTDAPPAMGKARWSAPRMTVCDIALMTAADSDKPFDDDPKGLSSQS